MDTDSREGNVYHKRVQRYLGHAGYFEFVEMRDSPNQKEHCSIDLLAFTALSEVVMKERKRRNCVDQRVYITS